MPFSSDRRIGLMFDRSRGRSISWQIATGGRQRNRWNNPNCHDVPLHRAMALIRIDHSLCAAEVAFSVKSGEFAVLDGYSRCRSRHSTRKFLSGRLRNALIANAFHLMLSKPATNPINSRFSSHVSSTKANALWSEAAACVKSDNDSPSGGACLN